jgi:hypothetical protein
MRSVIHPTERVNVVKTFLKIIEICVVTTPRINRSAPIEHLVLRQNGRYCVFNMMELYGIMLIKGPRDVVCRPMKTIEKLNNATLMYYRK